MSKLDYLREKIGVKFSDTELFFSAATLTRATGSGGWNEDPGSTATYPCKALVEGYSDHLRAVAGIPDTDSRILIVGTSIAVTPLKGDTVSLNGFDWSLIRVDVDPAKAMWTAQARPV